MIEAGFYNMDCMVAMKEFPDGFFDLAVVDPPYGNGLANSGGCQGLFSKYHDSQSVHVERERERERLGRTGTDLGKGLIVTNIRGGCHAQRKNSKRNGKWVYPIWRKDEEVHKKIISWDVAPEQEYFEELFRISRNQIIWGGNYFPLPPTRCFLIWRKLTISESFSMAMAEYAWTSFNDNAKVFEYTPQGKANDPRFHPTQKPVALYSWILNKYAKEGYKILDTHVGSASSLIACERAGYQYWGFEIDEEYYRKAKARLDEEKNKIKLF